MLENIDVSRILRRALAGGGEFADIYCEEGSATTVVCEDGKIEKVLAATDRGIGIRVISDLRTAYAYTNETTEAALLSLAETVSRAVRGKAFERPIDLRTKTSGPGFPIAIPPAAIPLQEKVLLVNRAERAARSADPRVRQVMVVYRDGTVRYQMMNSLGEFIETSRTGTVFVTQVVAAEGDLIQTGYEPVG
ncbi:MAG TPA: DNA gyrase modulator, partial [Geobacteraceae bacterium]|nr:DNA gyrase modulator [Geobacteraceae bacterium]